MHAVPLLLLRRLGANVADLARGHLLRSTRGSLAESFLAEALLLAAQLLVAPFGGLVAGRHCRGCTRRSGRGGRRGTTWRGGGGRGWRRCRCGRRRWRRGRRRRCKWCERRIGGMKQCDEINADEGGRKTPGQRVRAGKGGKAIPRRGSKEGEGVSGKAWRRAAHTAKRTCTQPYREQRPAPSWVGGGAGLCRGPGSCAPAAPPLPPSPPSLLFSPLTTAAHRQINARSPMRCLARCPPHPALPRHITAQRHPAGHGRRRRRGSTVILDRRASPMQSGGRCTFCRQTVRLSTWLHGLACDD